MAPTMTISAMPMMPAPIMPHMVEVLTVTMLCWVVAVASGVRRSHQNPMASAASTTPTSGMSNRRERSLVTSGKWIPGTCRAAGRKL